MQQPKYCSLCKSKSDTVCSIRHITQDFSMQQEQRLPFGVVGDQSFAELGDLSLGISDGLKCCFSGCFWLIAEGILCSGCRVGQAWSQVRLAIQLVPKNGVGSMMGLGLPLCSVVRNELFRFVNGAQGARGDLIMLKIYLLCYAALLKKSTCEARQQKSNIISTYVIQNTALNLPIL